MTQKNSKFKRGKSHHLPSITQSPKKTPRNISTFGTIKFLSPKKVFEKPILERNGLPKIKKAPSIWDEVATFYLIEQKIGSGTYGTVFAGKSKKTGQQVAIKHISNFARYEYDACKIIREIKIMLEIGDLVKGKKNCFIPRLLDIFVPEN
jgi:hypothetical protein